MDHEACRDDETLTGLNEMRSYPGSPTAVRQFGRFELLEEVKRGRSGVLYKARHLDLAKLVAVKILDSSAADDEAVIERFWRQVKTIGGLDHPNIVQALAAGLEEQHCYLAMEYVDGENLSQWLARNRPAPIRDALEIVRQAAFALAHVHGYGLVHRHVKPSNLMVTSQGTVKVLNAGLAKLQVELTGGGEIRCLEPLTGTVEYMAPEVLEGEASEVGSPADIWSLGAVLYELLTGSPPFSGAPGEVLAKIVRDDPPPPSASRKEIPSAVDALCLRMLARSPEIRYQNLRQVAEELDTILAGAEPGNPRNAVGRERENRRLAGGLLTALALTALFSIALWHALRQGGETGPAVVGAVGVFDPTSAANPASPVEAPRPRLPDRATASDSPLPNPQPSGPAAPLPSKVASPTETYEWLRKLGGEFLVKGQRSSWAPTGRQLAFGKCTRLSEPFAAAGIAIFDVDSHATIDLTETGKDPAWSGGDGRWIAYVTEPNMTEELWVVESSGGSRRRLGDGGFPTWSADGKTLFFSSRPELRLMALDMSDPETLPAPVTLGVSDAGWYPAVSRDGKRLAQRAGNVFRIFDTASGRIEKEFLHVPGGSFAGNFSPDGKYLAFGGFGGSDSSPCTIVDLEAARVVYLPSALTGPAWSPDGSRIIFDVRLHTGLELWMLDAVTLLESETLAWQPATVRSSPVKASN